jgi:IS5 family transposase
MPVGAVTADKAYDDGDNIRFLEARGIHSAIVLNRYRTHKKDPNKQVWIDLKASETYQAGIRERYKIERKFGEAKQGQRFGRCRYLEIAGCQMQAYLTAITMNLKRLVKLGTGTSFRVTASACV